MEIIILIAIVVAWLTVGTLVSRTLYARALDYHTGRLLAWQKRVAEYNYDMDYYSPYGCPEWRNRPEQIALIVAAGVFLPITFLWYAGGILGRAVVRVVTGKPKQGQNARELELLRREGEVKRMEKELGIHD